MYCVYITFYRGNKMPQFYIGSSSIDKVNSGYRGSVSSREYKQIWLSELEYNPELFCTKIISKHNTRIEALLKEEKLHKHLNVQHNSMYINKARASGCFGVISITKDTKLKMSLASKGKPKSDSHRNKIAEANRKKALDPKYLEKLKIATQKDDNWKKAISESLKNKPKSEKHKENISKALTGKIRGPMTEECKLAISKSLKGKSNPNKGRTYDEMYGDKAEKLKLEKSKKAKLLRANDPLLTCTWCNKVIKGKLNYNRYHGDKCKKRII